MKFGELLATSLISGWEAHYFDYWSIKEYIKRNTMELEGRKPTFNHQEFVALFLKEERRVALFVNGKLAEIVNELEFEYNRYQNYNTAVAQQLGAQVIKFDRFVNDAFNAEQKILKKYRKWTGQQTAAWFNEKTCAMARAQDIVHALVVALSTLSERQWAMADSWVPPDSFQRKTVKYWVRPEHATAAKLFIIQHIPILEVNKTPFPPQTLEGAEVNSQIHNYLSSVYMDNDQADCYHRRIALEEGANLLRVRWYGGDAGPDNFPRPNSGSIFFMELKTHHNPDVSGLKSTKERFPITAQMIPGFMSGKLTSDQVVDAMAAQGHIKLGKVDEQKELAAFIQNLIVSMKLKPWIRTVYHRTAFQRSDSNEVRISFDLPLILHPENPNWNGKDWMDLFKADNSEATPFGYGVLEVKTSDEPPSWVEELLATGWLIRVEKFSKFQHATAMFHPEAVRVLPYWINSDLAKQIDNEKPDIVSELVEKTIPHNSTLSTGSGGEPTSPLKDKVRPSALQPVRALKSDESERCHSPPRSGGRTPSHEDDLQAPLLSLNAESPLLASRASRYRDRDDVASLRSGVGGNKAASDAGGPASGGGTTKVVIQQPPPARGTNLTRMRVEPKVFFANERTFLKWMFAVVILISVSMTVMSISNKSIPYGITLLATACILILYALGLYRWRLVKILKREGTRFDDRVGPFLMGFCLLAAAVVVFVFAWTGGSEQVFVCDLKVPSWNPVTLNPIIANVGNVTRSVKIYGSEMPDLQTTLQRMQTCVTAVNDETQDEDPNVTPDNTNGGKTPTKDNTKTSKQAKPVIIWDVNNTFILPSTAASDPASAYLKHQAHDKTLVFNVRLDSPYFAVLMQYQNNCSGTLSYSARSEGNGVFTYAELLAYNIAQPPTTYSAVNQAFLAPLLANDVTLFMESELRSQYSFSAVKMANMNAIITILPQFDNIDDRALQINSRNVKVSVNITTMFDQVFSYSSLRQAQAFIQALYAPTEKQEDINARWKQ